MIQFILSNLEYAFLLLLLVFSFFIYWCINEKTGFQICIITLLSLWLVFVYQKMNIYIHPWLFENNFPVSFRLSWIIIAVVFFVFLLVRKKAEELLLKGGFRAYMISIAVVSFLLILYRPDFYFIMPGGFLLGMGIGYCLNKKYIGFKSSDFLLRKGKSKLLTLLARFFIGISIFALIIYRVLFIFQHVTESQNIFLYVFLCCSLLSLWISVAAPWIFIKLRLAGVVAENKPEQKND